MASDNLEEAAGRFGGLVARWTNDADPASGLSRDDADVIAQHVDRVLMTRGPDVPPLLLEPENAGVVAFAFDHLAAFAASWPAARVDAASGLSRADLDLLVASRGLVGAGPDPDGPPDIIDRRGMLRVPDPDQGTGG